MSLAVVIPTLNEAANIEATLAPVLAETGIEAIVVDGGSSDGTPDLAARAGARVLTVAGGRAAQLNTGAAATIAGQLLFLHADTRLPAGWPAAVRDTLADPAVGRRAVARALDGAAAAERRVAPGAPGRRPPRGRAYGDQALFLRRATLERLGGFAPLPIMEDWDLARRARALGAIRVHGLAVVTSPRRWRRLGVARTLIRNQMMHVGWRLGIAPDRLAAFYRR